MLTATPAPRTLAAGASAASRIRQAAERPVLADSVAAARILFGLLVAFSSVRFIVKGWVHRLWIEPSAHLTYPGFEWVRPLPGNWMYLLPVLTAAAGLAMALGWRHRFATTVFLITFTWTELIDAVLYLNHYWFLTLVGVLMLVLPVHHHWSLDARSGRVEASCLAPALALWALRAQLAVVYFFAGLAKLNSDWLLRGQPLRLWLSDRSDFLIVGPLLDVDAGAILASWSAAAFDLTIVGWLVWHRSRRAAAAILVIFHIATGALFPIGVFPLVMALMALVFLEPDWPTRLWEMKPRRQHRGSQPATPAGSADSYSPRSLRADTFAQGQLRRPGRSTRSTDAPRMCAWVLPALTVLAAVQIVLPLRHFAQPGNVRWNEDGYYLAWRVMLTEKAGFVNFRVTNTSTGQTWIVAPDEVLTDWQTAHASTRPDLIHATARLLEEELVDQRSDDLEIRVDAWVSMNDRPAARLIDPLVDLTAHDRGDLPANAVLPLNQASDSPG